MEAEISQILHAQPRRRRNRASRTRSILPDTMTSLKPQHTTANHAAAPAPGTYLQIIALIRKMQLENLRFPERTGREWIPVNDQDYYQETLQKSKWPERVF